MIESLVTFLHTHVIPLGGLGIFIASVLEEVVAPIPSAFVVLTGGFLFLSGTSGVSTLIGLLLKIAIPAAAGIAIGSLVIFGLAYKFGKPFVERFGGIIGLSWGDIEKMEKWFEKGPRDDIFIFVARCIPIIPSVAITCFSGLIRVNVKTYLYSTFLGTIVRASILGVIGWQIGNLYFKYAEIISRFENDILYTIILVLIVYIFYRRSKKRARIR